jgi:hypothetical protein
MMKFFRICDHTFEGCDHKFDDAALDSSGAENLFKIPNVVTLARAALAKPVAMIPSGTTYRSDRQRDPGQQNGSHPPYKL